MIKHLHMRIFGNVQGVFYRTSAKSKAIDLGITGFVQNESDGTVYIEAEGNNAILETFTAWCKKGPLGAKVEKVEITEGGLKNFEVFKIAYQNK